MTHERRTGRRAARAMAAGYAAAAASGTGATARSVEEVHRTIARVPFRVLRRIPVVSLVARLVERVHDAIVGMVYGGIRGGSGAAGRAAQDVTRRAGRPVEEPGGGPIGLAAGVRSALLGSHGDTLAAAANPLATSLTFYAGDGGEPLTPDGLRVLLPAHGARLCVFVHGICMDESAWWLGAREEGWGGTYGDRLQEKLGYTPLYVRYNTGLRLAENGRALAVGLEALVRACADRVEEVVIVGHSMGGLIAHDACTAAIAQGHGWVAKTRMAVTLGSPFRGSPLAKAGYVATEALKAVRVTAPLGRLADARSAGVQDLLHDQGRGCGAVPFYSISGSLRVHRARGPGRVLGDGLVPVASATPADLPGRALTAHFDGVGHLRLLNEPRVYGQIEAWLGA
ncbi:MAG TPA: hypothetical protein VK610_10730 [Rhodothermales bacterium]|nr:hypothetical protein [Rhodothermales bacterium]